MCVWMFIIINERVGRMIRKKHSFWLNLFLTFITGGLWLIVILILILCGKW